MKDMIQRMTEIEDTKKDQLNESIIECGDMPPAPMEMDRGNPVSINVSMNASGKEHVEDLLDMMKKAGLGGAEEVKPDMMPMRHDMEKFRSMVDGPGMGMDDIDMPDMKDKPKMLPKPGDKPAIAMDSEEIEEGGMSDKAIEIEEWIEKYETRIGNNGDTLPEGYVKYFMDSGIFSDAYEQNETAKAEKMIGKPYTEWEYDDQEKALEMMPITGAMFDEIEKITGTSGEEAAEMVADIMDNMDEGYDNEPEEDYKDTEYMTKDLSGGLNREKKAYKAAQRGDNAMAVESLYNDLMAQYKSMK